MKQFYTIAELVAANLPEVPRDPSKLNRFASENWRGDSRRARLAAGKTKPVWEYHYSLLPQAAQTRLLIVHSAPANDDKDVKAEQKRDLWRRYDALSSQHKAICEQRLKVIQMADELERGGLSAKAAIMKANAERALETLSKEPGISKEAIARARRDFLGVRPKKETA